MMSGQQRGFSFAIIILRDFEVELHIISSQTSPSKKSTAVCPLSLLYMIMSSTAASTATAASLDDDNNTNDTKQQSQQLHVVVIVLGDVGRSPRMQYHALSLLESGNNVTLVGYNGEDLIPQLNSFHTSTLNNHSSNATNSSPRLSVVRFSVPTPTFLQKIHRILYFIWRICSLSLWLLYALLFRVPSSSNNNGVVDVVLVQNPPALPTLLIAYIYCRIQGCIPGRKRPGLLIDWHNLGYSMFEGGGSIVKLAKIYEKAVAPLADAHLTVTHAMKNLLQHEILRHNNKKCDESSSPIIQVVADCPPSMFQPRSIQEQHDILIKLDTVLRAACPRHWQLPTTSTSTSTTLMRNNGNENIIISSQTLFTECYYCYDTISSSTNNGGGNKNNKQQQPQYYYRPRLGRPALVTSSTSWTSDEDFGILLAALLLLDEQITQKQQSSSCSCNNSLKVLVVVTGKGPQKAMYEEQISRLQLQHVAIITLWLQPIDYPHLLACADVGVSLHTSTSGYDLPMKILDLFGCQVPVFAKDFACLSELVQDDVNGRVFNNSHELSNLLYELLQPMTTTTTTITTNTTSTSDVSGGAAAAATGAGAGAAGPACHSFGALARYSAALEGRERWNDNWLKHAQPIILQTAKKHCIMSK